MCMALLETIRRWYLRHQVSLTAMSKLLDISPSTLDVI